jgi:fluoride exporter
MTETLGFAGVVLAGGAGALTRYIVTLSIPPRITRRFPWATFAINVSGALLLGLATGFAITHLLAPEWRSIVGTGRTASGCRPAPGATLTPAR